MGNNSTVMSIYQASDGFWHWRKTEANLNRLSKVRFVTCADAWDAARRIAHACGYSTEMDFMTWGMVLFQWEVEGCQLYREGMELEQCGKNRYRRAAWLRESLSDAQAVADREWATAELQAVAA